MNDLNKSKKQIVYWSQFTWLFVLFQAETVHETRLWVQNLRQQMCQLGKWRKRRNAMPNILLNHH